MPHTPAALVVGAGPVGLTAALALHQLHVPVAILEAENENRQRPGSRAIYLHNDTLRLLDSISPGLGFVMARHGLVWPVKRTLFRGRQVYMRHYPDPPSGQLPPFTSLPQVEIERYLWDACRAAAIPVHWGERVEKLEISGDGVKAVTGSGKTWIGPYVVGADGSHSEVRRQAGIGMEGMRSANTFIVVDVSEDVLEPLPLERVFHYAHPAMDGRNVLFVPFSGGWRVDLQLFSGDEVSAFAELSGVEGWLPQVMAAKYAQRVTWVSTYQFLQVVAERLADDFRRVLLVGEAAHLFAPFGARGLNSGVSDAVLAARAIALARQTGDEGGRLQAIDAFAEERLRASRYNRDAAGTALEHIQGESPGMRMKRTAGALLAPVWNDFGRWLDEGPYGPRSGPPGVSTKY